ncbi:MAG: twin-arginine translocation signal domain-containing protein [Gemmatimonas sp.]
MIRSSKDWAKSRRDFLRGAVAAAAALLTLRPGTIGALQPPQKPPTPAQPATRAITIYKDPNCGCCK